MYTPSEKLGFDGAVLMGKVCKGGAVLNGGTVTIQGGFLRSGASEMHSIFSLNLSL